MAKKMPFAMIQKELREKNLKLISDYEDYENLKTPIVVECINGHKINTTLQTTRSKNFTCPICVGAATKGENVSSIEVPEKNGRRIIGFDNASHNMGVAIFDDGKLVYYSLLKFDKGSTIERLNQIRDVLEDVIIPNWKPDFIQFEAVQKQRNFNTYDVLVKLHGVFELAADRYGVSYASTKSSVWRSHFAINKRKRELDKQAAIDLVKTMYGIETTDDVAEAILITKYRSDQLNQYKIEDLF